MIRSALPHRRYCETFTMSGGGSHWKVTIGFYDEGRVGEVFVSGIKTGTDLESVARDGAILLSLCLQHGVPLETIKHAITRNGDGSASTLIGQIADRIASRGDAQ